MAGVYVDEEVQKRLREQTASRLGISPDGITILKDRYGHLTPYLNADGVAQLMVKKFGEGGYSIYLEETSLGDPELFGYKAILVLPTGAKIENVGFAYLKEIKQEAMRFPSVARMMAATRAVLRACRFALGIGLALTKEEIAAIEELEEAASELEPEIETTEIKPKTKSEPTQVASSKLIDEEANVEHGNPRFLQARKQWWTRIRSLSLALDKKENHEKQNILHMAIKKQIELASSNHPSSSLEWTAENFSLSYKLLNRVLAFGQDDFDYILAETEAGRPLSDVLDELELERKEGREGEENIDMLLQAR
jgi:hypothetical protein